MAKKPILVVITPEELEAERKLFEHSYKSVLKQPKYMLKRLKDVYKKLKDDEDYFHHEVHNMWIGWQLAKGLIK